MKEQKLKFDVIPNNVPSDKKIPVLKVVRGIFGLASKEAKEVVESTPITVSSGISWDEAENFRTQLSNVGAEVIIQ